MNYESMQHNPISEKIVGALLSKTRNTDPTFFRIMVAYYFTNMASMMRTCVSTKPKEATLVNMYAINLAPSGFGKGYSQEILDNWVTHQFRERFLGETMPLMAEKGFAQVGVDRAARNPEADPDAEMERARKEYEGLGPFLYNFDSGTAPALKQLRHKLLLARVGALSLQVDEIGSNLLNNTEILTPMLELYDGSIKQKLVKNTQENTRLSEVKGKTPANMLLFGTPSKLLNGGKAEDEFISLLDTGYARRSFFGYVTEKADCAPAGMSAEKVWEAMSKSSHDSELEDIAQDFESLADVANVGSVLHVPKESVIKLIEYRMDCERRAAEMSEFEEIRRTEMSHRHSKVLRLAGAYAFCEGSPAVNVPHVEAAIKLAEESGDALKRLLNRERPHVRLANYLAKIGRKVTQADIVADLPFYKGSVSQKQEMLVLATAYGYTNNIVIKRSMSEGIEFIEGETIQPTDLSKLIVSYSTQLAHGYSNDFGDFKKLHQLTQADGIHWVNHHLNNGHRMEENAIPGFNVIVLDVDGGTPISTVQAILADYTYHLYTTKRHTDANHRYRIILPMNYTLQLNADDYREFMGNVMEWLPIEVDEATRQRAKKWLSHDGSYFYNEGKPVDVLPFIPRTSKEIARKQALNDQASLDAMERWVLEQAGTGNRNKTLFRYAALLADSGFTFEMINTKVLALNEKLPNKLPESEILGTVMTTIAKKVSAAA